MNPNRASKPPQRSDLDRFCKTIGVNFRNRDILRQVFVHRSYLNEHPDFDLDHNERLEFLGDAVLELAVTEHLYQRYPDPEGELTTFRSSIVRGAMLAKVARGLHLGDYLLMSRGEEKSGGKQRELILANTFEALVGAIYLDQGYAAVCDFVKKFLLVHLDKIIALQLHRDPKSSLQEWAQEAKGITPNYQVLEQSGPDHDRRFIVGVYLADELAAKGQGSSKQKAQEQAARLALKVIKLKTQR